MVPEDGDQEEFEDPQIVPKLTADEESKIEEEKKNVKEFNKSLLRKRKICPLIQGCNSIEHYSYLNKIHEGVYGIVYRAKDRFTNQLYAIKKWKLGKEKEGFPVTSLREINLLLSLHHPNIVNVREIVMGNSNDKIYVVMEYMEHELRDLMENMQYRFTMSEIKCLVKQLLLAMEYLHSKNIMHRDLKTSNLLYNNKGVLKVCDFGLARRCLSTSKGYTPVVVTLWYRAPEILLGNSNYLPSLDIWSVGCIFAELILREPLFPARGEIEQIDNIFKLLGTPTDEQWPGWRDYSVSRAIQFKKYTGNKLAERFPKQSEGGLSEHGMNLLKAMLTYDPEKRITATEGLKHPWFKEAPLAQDLDLMPTFPALNEISREVRKQQKRA